MADRIGDKIGPRLAQLMGQAALAARRDHAPIEARIRQVATQQLIDKAGHEFADHIGPLIESAIEANPDMDHHVRDYLLRTQSGKHQLQAIAGHIAMAGAGGVLGTLINNELAPFVYGTIQANPHLRLDAGTAASLAAEGLYSQSDADNEGGASGYDAERMGLLKQSAQSIPSAEQLLDLQNRGVMSEATVRHWLRRGALPDELTDAILHLARTELSPADAALAVTRSIFTPAEGAAVALKSGVLEADFATLVANTGEPLGLEQLLEALRRGFIDRARFDVGFRQARYRNEWAGTALQLAYAPMSTADAVEASIQGHLSIDTAKAKAVENGLEPADFQALYDTAGEPLSRTEMEQLYNRGKVTKAQVDQALIESRLKPKYTALAFDLHERLPEARQVSAMISHGVVTKQQGLALLSELGYTAEVAGFIVAEGTAVKVGAHKALTIAEIHQLYTAGVFDKGKAGQLLDGLGFDAADSAYLLSSWDLLAGAAVTRQAIGVVRSRYVARHFDARQAGMYLDSLSVAPAARDRYLMVWDIEREATVAVLSEAQIVAAHKKELISGEDAYSRLIARGYTDDDAHILLDVAPGEAIPA